VPFEARRTDVLLCCTREILNFYSCGIEIKKVFPIENYERKNLLQIYDSNELGFISYSMYYETSVDVTSILEPCQRYLEIGCAFVMDSGQKKAVWASQIDVIARKINSYKLYTEQIDTLVRITSQIIGK
jgi:hypothetical protein